MNNLGVDELLTPIDVSQRLKIPRATLYGWRHRGVGPEAIRVGRHLRYRASDVEKWIEGQRDQDYRS